MSIVSASTLLLTLGVIHGLGALWMIVAPFHWYNNLPANVPEFGPYNHHFIRDVSIGFFLSAACSIYAARNAEIRVPMAWCAMFFPVGHAIVHVIDCIAMNAGLHRWLLDLPLVHMVAFLYLAIVESVTRPKTGFFRHVITPN